MILSYLYSIIYGEDEISKEVIEIRVSLTPLSMCELPSDSIVC